MTTTAVTTEALPVRSPRASACEPYRELIAEAVRRGRNAVAIYQDLVDDHGFTARYASVKRFVGSPSMRVASACLQDATAMNSPRNADEEVGHIHQRRVFHSRSHRLVRACAALIGVGMYRRNWNILMIGVMLLAVAVWNTFALLQIQPETVPLRRAGAPSETHFFWCPKHGRLVVLPSGIMEIDDPNDSGVRH